MDGEYVITSLTSLIGNFAAYSVKSFSHVNTVFRFSQLGVDIG